MKNLKKVLALVIALTMVLSTVAFASYPDVDADANYASAVELLSALNVLKGDDNGNFNPDNTITRAEFAAVVCRALGMENSANSAKGATIFTDVAADHWATGYINLASQQGIVNGKGNGIFDPEGNVTFAEAVKMLVVALGYEPMAASRGGYPTGYLTVANSTKMTANVSSSGTDTAALRSTVAQLTANALEIANMDQTGFGSETKYEVLDNYDDYTTLLTKMDIYKATGVVTKVDATDDTAELKLTEASDDYEFGYMNNKGDAYTDFDTTDRIVTFNINGSNIESYLQQSVDVYVYKNGKSDYDIVYVTASGIGSSLKIDADDLAEDKANIVKKTTSVSDSRVEYYENSDATKTTKIDVKADAPIYVNGYDASNEISYPADLYTLLKDTGATIEFVENTDDKYYDMVLITVYQHGIVDEASASKEKISFVGSDPSSVKFDSADSKQVVNITDKNGNAITLDDVKKDDVLAMLVKGDSSNVKVTGGVLKAPAVKNFSTTSNEITIVDLGANTVTGSISEADDDTLYIDGTEYDMGIFVDGNKDKVYKNGEAKLGTEGTFYLDINGKVIGFDGTAGGNTSFGYILQAEYNESNSFDKGWEVKMLTEKDGIVTFTMNTSYTINDADGKSANDTGASTKTTAADKFLSAFGGKTAYNDENTARLVEYKVTSDSKLKTIDNLETVKSAFSDGEYKDSTTKVGSYVLDEDVIIFNLDETDIDDVTAGTLSTLVDGGKYAGYVADDAANTTSDYGIFVVTSGTTKYDPENGFFVVSGKKTSTLGDKDSVVITYYDVDATAKTATFTDDAKKKGSVDYDDLKKGDVFVANLNSDGVVKDYAVLAQFNTSTNQVIPVTGAFQAAYGNDMYEKGLDKGVDYVYGYLTKINTSNSKTVLDVCYDGTNSESFAIGKDAGLFNYAQGKNGTIKCDWDGDNVDEVDDNNKCTFVFMKLYDGTVTDVYTVDIRLDKASVSCGSTKDVENETGAKAASTKTEVKEEVKTEAPVVEVPVAEEDFE